MPNPQNIEPYKMQKGETLNPNGRPRKIYTVLKESGYTKDDVRNAFNEIAWADVDELQRLFKDPKSPAIIKVIAHAYKRAIEKGDYRYVSEIIMQSIGKPQEKSDIKSEITIRLIDDNDSETETTPGTDRGIESSKEI
jgi:hypothetical protein